ncbi:hypothetical protein [Neobacillus sp. DY30]|uniref:hypothetical protein n=1 Tax=Neobacillus sp. DY30 TaxID=3047871 RepID=UPI0024BFFDBA|nr:hypothetical protein [Neobacillus sp. DY30]WHX98190.1 hypothetical protein QNH29_16130 [Neobacillus sp. DY30]
MSPKGKHIKKHHKDESSDFYVEDKQFEKKKHHKDKSYSEDKQVEKKKHKDKSKVEDKKFEKKKRHKDKSSDVHVEDKPLKRQNFDDSQRAEFVYYDPSIIQEADVFQAPLQNSDVSHEKDEETEALARFFNALEQLSDENEHGIEAKDQDEMKE